MRVILLNMMLRSCFLVCSLLCGTRLVNGCADATHSLGDWTDSVEGDQNLLRVRSPHLLEARSGIWEGERASEGRRCFERGTLNADKKSKPEGSHSVQLSRFMARVAGACSELEQSIHLPKEEQHRAMRSNDDYRSAQSLAFVMVLRI